MKWYPLQMHLLELQLCAFHIYWFVYPRMFRVVEMYSCNRSYFTFQKTKRSSSRSTYKEGCRAGKMCLTTLFSSMVISVSIMKICCGLYKRYVYPLILARRNRFQIHISLPTLLGNQWNAQQLFNRFALKFVWCNIFQNKKVAFLLRSRRN